MVGHGGFDIMEMLVIASLLSIIIGILGFIAQKLDKNLTEIHSNLSLAHERHDVSDVMISHIIKESYNSKAIANGQEKWPNIFVDKSRDN
jgi:hypothetical protein